MTARASAAAFDARAWRADLWRRVVAVWYIKSTGTPFWIWAFFNGYFYVLRNPLAEPLTMPLTPLDAWVGFHPGAVGLYVSLWLYVSLAPALLKNFCELFAYGIATLLLSVIGLAIFYLWPTAVPFFDIDIVAHPSLAVLKGVDMTGNACPSLHVAFAIFTAVWLHRILREMASPRGLIVFNWLWCLGIVWSTLATRQHVMLDVLAGTLLGLAVAYVHVRAMRPFEAWWAPRAAAAMRLLSRS